MKKNIFLLFIISLFCFYCFACSGSKIKSTSKILTTGEYGFTLSDSLWKPLLSGTMNIDTANGDVIGSYKITNIKNSNFPGYSNLTGGDFKGSYNKADGTISLNMNPKVADANVYLALKITGEYLTGKWNYSTMTGNLGSGNVKAALKD